MISVFPNRGRQLHTTRSWQFLGLAGPRGAPRGGAWRKARFGADTIIGNFDTGEPIRSHPSLLRHRLPGRSRLGGWVLPSILAAAIVFEAAVGDKMLHPPGASRFPNQ